MKKKSPILRCRLPIDFGDEPICIVPVQQSPVSFSGIVTGPSKLPASGKMSGLDKNFGRPTASPSPGGEGRGEGELNTKFKTKNSRFRNRGFTLVEIMVVLVLLSLIVFALMAVFNGTQRALRLSLTQTDSLEGGRAVMDLIADDLASMTPSGGIDNVFFNNATVPPRIIPACPVNFSAAVTAFPLFPPSPLVQSLLGSPDNAQRTNILENIFILSKANINGVSSWIGTGYAVNTNLADGTLYPLYRFYMATNASAGFPAETNLFFAYNQFQFTNSAVWSHLMDGVVNLTMQTYDTNGVFMTNGYYAYVSGVPFIPVQNAAFVANGGGFTTCFFFSNAVPASVQVILGTLEDRTLQHAESLNGFGQSNYLAGAAGQVHLFSRRVWIRNLDPTAYQ
jgi:prepilin-type N-terminal cleavage/methylation domain-containing protein